MIINSILGVRINSLLPFFYVIFLFLFYSCQTQKKYNYLYEFIDKSNSCNKVVMVSAYGCGYCMLSYKYFNEEIDNLNISLTIVDYITKDESLQKMNIEKFPNLKFIYIEENKIISKINRFPTFLVFDKNLEFIKKKIGWENSFIIYLKQLKCS